MPAVARKVGVDDRTMRRWCDSGHVESRRDGPRLRFVLVHDGGKLDGRPVGLGEEAAA